MSFNADQETSKPESPQIIESSLRYSIANIRKIMIETEMLRREYAGLTDLANSLGDYHSTVLPAENARMSDDELFFKWIEQISRYRTTAKGVYEIFESKHKRLTDYINLAGEEVKQLPHPLPDDITIQLAEITQYAEDLSKLER